MIIYKKKKRHLVVLNYEAIKDSLEFNDEELQSLQCFRSKHEPLRLIYDKSKNNIISICLYVSKEEYGDGERLSHLNVDDLVTAILNPQMKYKVR